MTGPNLFLSRCCLAILFAASGCKAIAGEFDHGHSRLDAILQEHVHRGMVNYRALATDPEPLRRYLNGLAAIDASRYVDWTRSQKLALWINAYNAYTIKAILDHYPIQPSWTADPLGHYPANSIQQIPGVWDRMTWPVMGREVTLDYMEHEVLRKELGEPRVHYVLVCASIGCPNLENRAFDAASIEQRLELAGRNYIYDSRRIRFDRQNGIVGLPQIYKWFAEDFQPSDQDRVMFDRFSHQEAGWLSWVYRYARDPDRELLLTQNYKIVFLYYDWGLNEQR